MIARQTTSGSSPSITLVYASLRYGAPYLEALQAELSQLGLRTQVVTAQHPTSDDCKQQSVRYFKFAPGRNGNRYGGRVSFTLISPRLALLVARSNPDLVIAFEYSLASFWALLGAKLAGAKIAILQEHRANVGVARRVWRKFLRSAADHLIANTEAAYQQLRAEAPARSCSQIMVITPPLLNPTEVLKSDIFHLHGTTTFLYAGQLEEQKNVSILLRAVARLSALQADCHLLIAGEGPQRSSLEATVAELSITSMVTFLGKVPHSQMGALLSECDVFVFPSRRDYRSLAVLEALQLGKPVIDSRGDGNAGDSVQHALNGFLFDSDDLEQLVSAMMHFIANPDACVEMGNISKAYMSTRTPAAAAAHLAALVEHLESGPSL